MAFAPVVWMAISAASTAVGAGISAYGMIQQGKAAEKQGEYQAKVDENNATRAGYASIQAQEEAGREVDAIRDQHARVAGSQFAAAGKSGLTLSGSVLDSMNDTAIQTEREIQMAKYRGNVNAYNAQTQGQGLLASAGLSRMSGSAAKKSAYWSAAGTMVSAAGSTAGSYAQFKKG